MSVTFATKSKINPFSLAPTVLVVDESSSDGETIGQARKSPLRKEKAEGEMKVLFENENISSPCQRFQEKVKGTMHDSCAWWRHATFEDVLPG